MLAAVFVILIGFAPGQGNDQAAKPDASSSVAGRIAADMTFDQTARFLARRLGPLLPGQPRGEVRFMPGAAGFVAATALARAKPDGFTLGLVSSNAIMGSAFGAASNRFDARALTWIGGVTPDAWVCVARADAPKDRPLWAGSLGVGSRGDMHARALAEYAGANLRILSGYASRFELVRSLETGEIDAACGWPLHDLQTRRADWFADGRMEIFAQFSTAARALGPVPHAKDLARGEPGRTLLGALELEATIAWTLAAPPGLDPAQTALWRNAFSQLSTDKDAREDAARSGVTLEPVSAQDVEEAVRKLHDLAPEVKAGLGRLGGVGR